VYLGKQPVVHYDLACTYGCTAVLLCTIRTCDRDPRSLSAFDQEVVLANRKFSGVSAWRAKHVVALQQSGQDGAAFGVHVLDELTHLGWRGKLTRATLPDPFLSLEILDRETAGDHTKFAVVLADAAAYGVTEQLTGRKVATRKQTTVRPVVVTMSDVEAEAIEWLWWPYLALGKVAMLDGDPGIGKSLLLLMIAAALSQSRPLPDQQGRPILDPGGAQATLLLCDEDGLGDTIRPRLQSAEADCTKIHVLTGWLGAENEVRRFTLQHMPVLEAAMQQYQPRLVVIDPIQAYLGNVDMNRAGETRPLLGALTQLAEKYHCAIVCIRHPSKPGQGIGKAIHRGMGSVDFIGAARTGLFVEQHPADPGKVLLAQMKSNIGRLGRTQVFSKDEGKFEWCGVSRLTAELIGGSGRGPDPHRLLEVVCWLEKHMTSGSPQASKAIEDTLTEEGYSHDLIKRAKKALGIISNRVDDKWYWTLPTLPELLQPLPLLPPLQKNQEDMSSGGREEQEGQEVEEGKEVEVAAVVSGENTVLHDDPVNVQESPAGTGGNGSAPPLYVEEVSLTCHGSNGQPPVELLARCEGCGGTEEVGPINGRIVCKACLTVPQQGRSACLT
jgi:DNA repair protein RadA/Sms